jgi:hypothetical protein
MSWDKQTIVLSEIDALVRVFDEIGYPYRLESRGTVEGQGRNDDNWSDIAGVEAKGLYKLRRLRYSVDIDSSLPMRDFIIQERMIQTDDCDTDDTLVSVRYATLAEANAAPLVVQVQVEYDPVVGED